MKKVGNPGNMKGKKWDHESPQKGMKATKHKGMITKSGRRSSGPNKKARPKSTDGIPADGKFGLSEEERTKYKREAMEMLYNGASNGGDFWAVHSKLNREKIFTDPLLMLESAAEYFAWNKMNPWVKYEYKDHELQEVPLARPLTMEGLTSYLNCGTAYFFNFENQIKKDDPHYVGFKRVIQIIKESIRRQKFEGAAIGAFNANLISYDLGIRKDVPNGMAMGGGLNVIVEKPEYESLLEETKMILEALDDITGDGGIKQLSNG